MSNKLIVTEMFIERTFKGGFIGSSAFTKRDGSAGKQFYKVWTNTVVMDGSTVSVSGVASARLNEYTDRNGQKQTNAELQINDALVQIADAPF